MGHLKLEILCLVVGSVVALLALNIDSALANTGSNADEEGGPVFVKEPPSKVDFSNSTGAEIPCQSRGTPQPEIIWLRGDGTAVGDVPGLRQVLASGALVFPPFRAEDYRQEVHSATYICLARNSIGTIHSRDVHVRAVVSQHFIVEVNNEHVIRNNCVTFRCNIPAFTSDFVSVSSWLDSDGTSFTMADNKFDGKFVVLPSGELHIKDVRPEDGFKEYRCQTKHRLTGETRLSASAGKLVITDPQGSTAPRLSGDTQISGFARMGMKGSTFGLICPSQSFPPGIFKWYKFTDGSSRQPVQLDDRLKQLGGTLIIREAKVEDSGKYLCVVSNSVGEESVETVLTVTAPLAATVEPAVQTVDFGRPATFTCHYQGSPVKNITWMKNGKRLPQTEAVIRIDAVRREDRGMFQCFVRNDQDSAQSTAELKLGGRFDPPRLTFKFREEVLQPGPKVSLKCKATGNPSPEIVWELDSKKVTNADRVQVGQFVGENGEVVSHVNITNVHSNDGGVYRCTAISKVGSATHTGRLNIHGLPHVKSMDKAQVVAGSGMVKTCPVAGYPIDAVIWEKDNRVLPINRRQSVFPNGTLVIDNVQRNMDQGTYTCVARNAQGYTSRGNLEVQVMVPPSISFMSFGETAFAGSATQATCLVANGRILLVQHSTTFTISNSMLNCTGDTPLQITWSFEGGNLSSHLGLKTALIGSRTSMLLVEPVSLGNQGIYTCTARNAAGVANASAALEVFVPPRWIVEPTDRAFAQGSDAKIECKSDGFPKPSVAWKKAAGDGPMDYRDLKGSAPGMRVEDGNLVISAIPKQAEGYYLCEANNGIGAGLSAVIYISVQAPPQFEIKFRNQTARKGEPAVLQCEAKGEKPIGILWSRDGKRLDPKPDPRYTIREEILSNGVLSDLSVKRSERTDSALFTCVATNAFGSDETSLNLIVQEPPEVPFGLKVLDKSGRSVQLQWSESFSGNSPITRFYIEYKMSKSDWNSGKDRVLVPGSQTMASVYNLRPATTYHLRLVAENEVGTSEASQSVTIITAEEAPSGPPTGIAVEPVDQHTLKVTWKPPLREEWNGDIMGYYVGYKLASSDKPYLFETVEFSREVGKEHHLMISNLKTYTEYSVVVQAFNRIGPGPMSKEVAQHTAEGKPDHAPQDISCTTLTSQSIRVSWTSPPLASANGVIKGYKVIFGPASSWYDEKTKEIKATPSSEIILHGLKKYTNYNMTILAYTNGGDGIPSTAVSCHTEQDVPGPPTAVKASVMSGDAILLSWQPPSQPNGVVTQYTVYQRTVEPKESEATSQKIPSFQTTYEISGLKRKERYEFWVTAHTAIGEGQPSKSATTSPSNKVPAKIASFAEKIVATHRDEVKLPCQAVGVPAPEIKWKVKGQMLTQSNRLRVLPDGSLLIKEVTRKDAGDYACKAENSNGHDTIMHTLVVQAPPQPPSISLAGATGTAITVRLKSPSDSAPLHGLTIHYKQDFGEWEATQIPPNMSEYTLEGLNCGTRYQIYATSYNSIGTGEASDILNTRTKGQKPGVPSAHKFIEVSQNSVTLHLSSWDDGGCPMLYFVVEYKARHQSDGWTMVSNSVKPSGNYVVLDLSPATWYQLRVTAHNNVGFTQAEFEFATLTLNGNQVGPARTNDNGRGLLLEVFPWLPEWVDYNMIVAGCAMIVIIVVGLAVICIAVSRRNRGPESFRLRDEGLYAQPDMRGMTLKREFRDELGYIAPPNRKLPPVPGSNYSTCDRHKKGMNHPTWNGRRPAAATGVPHTYEELANGGGGIYYDDHPPVPPHAHSDDSSLYSKPPNGVPGQDEEICPYATFHLLGFREEMDPSKGSNGLTLPHGSTTLPPPGHGHHRGGSQSAPRGSNTTRYGRGPVGSGVVSSVAGGGTVGPNGIINPPNHVFSPEYDDPANIEDEYGYNSPNRRGSLGRRSMGSMRTVPIPESPSPPPPPPRPSDSPNSTPSHSQMNQSNDSKESNELSEAECDRDPLIRNRNSVSGGAPGNMSTEEMRRLIENRNQNEAHSIPNGLTPYDTVNV
ncbi:Down syndrome cell adhesion molecule-like protein Dscam2 isoform X15 [Folsomia candida]|uniref:Down syndrome cell adhesion molecule-like protein Dscam2 isoform X15 n=1 Tax=Folsomia candida TaxID=158441 RepID=UPI001604F002|nr:Down syndrome cell adhesion molecule-like protein Dscam2 isoform X15 [Folsomia candida]